MFAAQVFGLCCAAVLIAQEPAKEFSPPDRVTQDLVTRAFSVCHDGWSVDEVLLQDDLRRTFLDECYRQSSKDIPAKDAAVEDAWCRALLHVRKRGGERLPRTTRRAEPLTADDKESLEASAEISSRRLWDERSVYTDAIVVDRSARQRFDELCRELQPEASGDVMRRLALNLRKARRLEPELLSRVTDWQREIIDYPLGALREKLGSVPERPGIYLFRDLSGYLYIGQAQDLRDRLTKHLKDSDRRTLAAYLQDQGKSMDVTVELHVFKPGSPAEQLAVRRAYESELIRTRNPQFNLAP